MPASTESFFAVRVGASRITPAFTSGELAGQVVDTVDPNSQFRERGVKPGDRIVSINGLAIDSSAASREALCRLSRPEPLSLEIERPGAGRVRISVGAAV